MIPIPLLLLLGAGAGATATGRPKIQTRHNSSLKVLLSKPRQNKAQQKNEKKKELTEHRAWLNELSGASDTEADANHKLAISTTAFGFASAGTLFYPPLLLFALPIMGASLAPIAMRAIKRIIKRERVPTSIVELGSSIIVVTTGHFMVVSLGATIYHFNRKLLLMSEDQSAKNFVDVFNDRPQRVFTLVDGVELEVELQELQKDDIIVVNAGQTLPADGIVNAGEARIDQRSLTGEAQPAEKRIGEKVFATTTVIEGRLEVQVQQAGSDTIADQLGSLIRTTNDFKSTMLSKGERIVDLGSGPTLALTAVAWTTLGFQSAMAMQGTSIGYQMRIGAPLSILHYLGAASHEGILVKDGRSLELLAQVDTVLFDKTGTLTDDIPRLEQISVVDGWNEDQVLTFAATAEQGQSHPLAQAILKAAEIRGIKSSSNVDVACEAGLGLRIYQDDQEITIGSIRLMESSGIPIDNRLVEALDVPDDSYATLVYIAIGKQLIGILQLVPTLRPDAKLLINALRKRGLDLHIVSGDQPTPTQRVADALGIESCYSEMFPHEKAELVKKLQKKGRSVCFVGDGINDAIALKQANVSISMHGASAIAIDSASAVLMKPELNLITKLFDLSDQMRVNLNRGVFLTIAPGVTCAAVVLFGGVGITGALVFYNVTFLLSLGNGLLPYFKSRFNSPKITSSD